MRGQTDDYEDVMFNHEVEPPTLGYSGLPDPPSCVVLLSPQRRMTEVLGEETTLFVEGFLNLRGSSFIAFAEALG